MQPPRLIFSDLITEAFSRVTGNVRALFDIALVPTVISVGLSLAGRLVSGERMEPLEAMAIKVFDFVPTAMFAVAWYRLVLLGPQSVSSTPGFGWTVRERGYLGQLLLIAAIPIILHALFWMLMPWPMEMPGSGQVPPDVERAMPVGFAFTVTAIIALRLSFGLVAPSVDLAWTPRLSWRYGKGNGPTILFALLLLMVIGVIVKALTTAILLTIALGLFGAPLSIGPWLLITLVAETVAYMSIAPLVTVQALIFRALTGWAPGGPLRQPPP
ncbi:hypothetical protein [Reyranella sp. CPCC 100927]|uniref:hypothetical protein n=1 Tax=Reyranella sp. CPCC 100927 TaxID=2599616 RepID=UPI0011B5CF5A|nr:hypothetical protein [Reyranella sp. CPCC 100927]TWT15863.1 hypothetical protein FQU96_05865 [Reyranella sp. CPCC 100927]